jgi:hypothetical protein
MKMRKFKCNECYRNCFVNFEVSINNKKPLACVISGLRVDWQEVQVDSAETTQTTVKYEKCFAWVKVGEWVYSTVYKEYVQISDIDEFNVSFNSSACCSVGHKSFLEDYVPARKRKFNEKEMRGLVGKVITDVEGDATLITDFDNVTKNIRFLGEWWKSDELADSTWKLDGKPCFKLEHLDEKGQWVE